jgi:hypothetical protein
MGYIANVNYSLRVTSCNLCVSANAVGSVFHFIPVDFI